MMRLLKNARRGSRISKNYIIAASVLIILFVALVLAKRQREAFAAAATGTMPLPADWKGPKTSILTREGIHTFFTDGSLLQDTRFLESSVIMLPTFRDTQCYLTNTPHTAFNCTHLPLEEFASVDTTAPTPPDYACTSTDAVTPMHNAKDDVVRILNCEYNFRKQCLTLHSVALASTFSSPIVTMDLPVNKLSTTLFVLSRPLFVRTLNSVLYKVSYLPTHYTAAENSIMKYSNKSNKPVRVVLLPASGTLGTKTFTLSTGKSNIMDDAVASAAVIAESRSATGTPTRPTRSSNRVSSPMMSVNMFYLTPKRSVADDVPGTEAFTIFFRTLPPLSALPPVAAPGDDALPAFTLFNHIISVTAQKSATQSVTLQVRRNSAVAELSGVSPTSSVLITYSVNYVLIATMDPNTGAIRMQRFTGFPRLTASAAPAPALLQAINAAKASLPSPLLSLSIPSPLDVARLLNVPLGV